MEDDIDMLSDIPEALQLRILSCLDAKQAVQTSMLSRTWVSLWTKIPVLEFRRLSFNKLDVFNTFVNKVLCRRDHLAKLDTLKFIAHKTSTQILKSVFDYAFSHGVKQLEASIVFGGNIAWPLSVCDSLRSLKLVSWSDRIKCPFLQGSTSFKNLTVIYLKGALITDVEPFSGFPMLESLTLLSCGLCNSNKTLRIHNLRLWHLIISTGMSCMKLETPRLRFLKYRGYDFPKHEGLSVLETLVIGYWGFYNRKHIYKRQEKRVLEDLLFFFSGLHNVKSLTLYSPIALLLNFYPDELMKRSSPFRVLKNVKMEFPVHCGRALDVCDDSCKESAFKCVKDYLLQHVPDAEFTITLLKADEWYDDDI
ncbi:putative F-box/LRR-repeat protein At5g02930 [Lactuca sativa]|uniref:putative F-box/LRR-repeat protein At5g02930 n=1 Tax=Lactuca sativa TaxID=4236 RepID=UPI000CBE1E5F|nr:putative F-box/LRR-repeat protein At5g02930 [Lactuca sativa]